MPPIRITAGTKAAPPKAPKASKPVKAAAPRYNLPTAPVRGPKTVSNYSPPGKSDTATPTATRGPRMVSNYHAPKVTKAQVKPTKSHGTSWLSVITNPAAAVTGDLTHALSSAAHTAGHIAENAGKDIYQMPAATIEGVETVGKAAAQDFVDKLLHGNPGVGGPTSSGGFFNDTHLGKIAHSAWQSSAVHDIVNGNIKGAVDKFTKHPVYTALDFAGGAGALGRIAGATARTGALGEKVAEAASLAREPRVIAPGLQNDVRHYSPNLLKKGGQVYLDRHPALGHAVNVVTHNSDKQLLRRQMDEIKAQTDYARQKGVEAAAHDLHAEMPKRKTHLASPAAHVVPYAAQGIARLGDQTQFLDDLQTAVERLDHEHDHGNLTPRMRAANRKHAKNIRTFLKHPDVEAVRQATAEVAAQRHALDTEQASLGLRDAQEMRQRALMPYVAAGHMPGARIATEPEVSIRQASWREANKAVKKLDKQLQDVKLNTTRITNGPSPFDAAIRDAQEKLANARVQEQRTYGILLGRHGRDAPLDGPSYQTVTRSDGRTVKLKRSDAVRMNRYLDKTAAAQHALDQARLAAHSDRADWKDFAQEWLAAAKDDLKDAKEHRKGLSKYENEKLTGVVTNTDMKIGKGKYAVRHVTPEEIEAHMRANGVDPEQIAYVNMSAPPAKSIGAYLRKGGLSRGDSKGRAFTGQGLQSGSWEPGYGALAKSQLRTVNKISQAKGYDEFIKQAAVHDASGNVLTYLPHDAEQAAADYTAQHGVEVTPVATHSATVSQDAAGKIQQLQRRTGYRTADRFLEPGEAASKDQRFALVPTEMTDRYLKHLDADKVGHGMVGALNRQFRNTVLPFSAKWLMGNDVEAALRLGLNGAGPRDAALAGKVVARMHEMGDHEGADRLESLMSGLHYGMAHRANVDAIGASGALGSNSPEVLQALRHSPVVKQVADAYSGLVQRIYTVNRNIERLSEQAALGAHMHRQMREFGSTWLQAAQHEQAFLDKLAKGYSDPALALDAGRYVRDTLGQYDRFSPAMRRLVASWAPFLPWYKNAVQFVYSTLPLKHPITQAVMLHAAQTSAAAFNQQTNEVPHGSFFGLPNGSLTTSLRTGPTSYLDLARYTPMGAFSDGPVGTITGAVGPQLQGPFLATEGLDPFGRAIRDPQGNAVTDSGQRALLAINQLLESGLGPADVLHRVVQQHGSTPYQTDTLWNTEIKPDTHHGPPGVLGGVDRVWNPLFPTYLSKNSGSSSNGGLGEQVGLGSGSNSLGTQVGLK